ncbi:sigma-70 family RNA polymerase sigma factor [Methylobacterium currus]|uniref:sigma-70 family RNA polymerase sigma factor n=1 Tax=Methylobacterium currus TaxID=2051553 RepID=UPI001E3B3384|nr:sigma-70 family RNA polymerase sigma factor [Methylobacterium currus]UHC14683.1 sigma-70 family RNA polymerase sigma factor [Methylobacterium currus]
MGTDEAEQRDVAAAIRGLSTVDLVRLRALARLRARRLPGLDWSDILHEAIVRALDGTRRWPPEVPILVFLAGCMRSIEHDLRRRLAQEQAWRAHDPADCEGTDLERAIAAAQALGAIVSLFSGDETVLWIIEGLGHGRSAAEIRARHGLSQTDYDSARKRLRRALLRLDSEGGQR